MQILFLLQVRASSHAHIHTRKEAHGREHAAAGQRETERENNKEPNSNNELFSGRWQATRVQWLNVPNLNK